MKDIDRIQQILEEDEKIVIVPHRKPDGDALGASLALYHFLKAHQHDVTVVAPSPYPHFLQWMPGNDRVKLYKGNEKEVGAIVHEAAYLFCVDFNDFGRVDDMEETLREAPGKKILIDHHLKPENTFDYFYTDDQASATAELIYDFICTLGGEQCINKAIAECIYTGILTDTGSFRFDRTTAKVHRIVATLIEKGVRPDKVHQQVYDSFTEDRMRFFGYCLQEKLTILREYNTAFIALTPHEMRHYNVRTGDTDGLVNYPLALEGIQMAALMKEQPSPEDNGQMRVKISFRSKDNFSVNEFARKHFNGGGHQNAAGGISYENLEQTIQKFVEALPQYKTSLTEPQTT